MYYSLRTKYSFSWSSIGLLSKVIGYMASGLLGIGLVTGLLGIELQGYWVYGYRVIEFGLQDYWV